MKLCIKLYGVVQGVGFRPYAKRLAKELLLFGTVRNSDGLLIIDISGDKEALDEYVRRLTINAPKSARITHSEIYEVSDNEPGTVYEAGEEAGRGFHIIYSEKGTDDRSIPVIAADIGTCDKCAAEMMDRNNRRYMHPFISCTDCGPRYSIIKDIPYDRDTIVMDEFEMCGECKTEYSDISDRRCHAQTIACLCCGPKLTLEKYDEKQEAYIRILKKSYENLMNLVKEMLHLGDILAIKDIGGYHFVCRADDKNALSALRELKKRQSKAFAVMFRDIEEIKKYAYVNEEEEKLLVSDARPIVFLKKRSHDSIIEEACADSMYIGAMLPCNPVQIYICDNLGPLVMTSGNLGGEPIVTDDDKMRRLAVAKGVIDGIVSHNRKILTPLDDSIMRVICGRSQILRRARGFVPLPVYVNNNNDSVILASGGDLKGAFCFMSGNTAICSQYFGDLDDYDACGVWKKNVYRMEKLFGLTPKILACDMHPRYYSAAAAKNLYEYERIIEVQHHHAHIASVAAEHGLDGNVFGFSFDGTGYGTDGTIWGGEVILHKGASFERLAHLKTTPMCGGDEISRDGEMALMCYLHDAGIDARAVMDLDAEKERKLALVESVLTYKVGIMYSSSMGRLFDAVSTLLKIKSYNSYEGECAIALEKAACDYEKKGEEAELCLKLKDGVWDTPGLIRQLTDAIMAGRCDTDREVMSYAYAFHKCIADAVVNYTVIYNREKLPVALSGGVFANSLLTKMIVDRLEGKEYKVYLNEQVPFNDGGIAIGQAYIAAAVLNEDYKKEI